MIRADEVGVKSARGSRGTAAIAACVALGALALALPRAGWSASHRAHHQTQVNASVTGPLTIAWQGDPAQGCAAAGLCGVSGTLQMHFGNSEASGNGPPELIANDDSAVARVQTTALDGSVTTCADLVPIQFDFAVRRTGGGRVAGVSHAFGSGQPPNSGRCAGPTSGDLAKLTVPVHQVGHGYDLSGRASFTAGPFAVTVISGVRAHITFGSQGGGGPLFATFGPGGSTVSGTTAVPVRPRPVLVERARVSYRVTAVSGALTTSFAGLAPPQCDALGACGLSGRLVQSFADHGTLSFAGARLVHRRVGREQALAALRAGRMTLSDTFAEQHVHETVVEASTQTGGLPCAARSTFALAGALTSRSKRGRDELALAAPNPGFGFGPPDLFRTPCPGPSAQDVLGPNGGALATATVTAGHLGDGHLSITFRRRAGFHSSAYAGRRAGAVVVSLVLVRSTGGTHRVKLFPGEPVFP